MDVLVTLICVSDSDSEDEELGMCRGFDALRALKRSEPNVVSFFPGSFPGNLRTKMYILLVSDTKFYTTSIGPFRKKANAEKFKSFTKDRGFNFCIKRPKKKDDEEFVSLSIILFSDFPGLSASSPVPRKRDLAHTYRTHNPSKSKDSTGSGLSTRWGRDSLR